MNIGNIWRRGVTRVVAEFSYPPYMVADTARDVKQPRFINREELSKYREIPSSEAQFMTGLEVITTPDGRREVVNAILDKMK